MPFEQKKEGKWVRITEREAFIELTESKFRFPGLAMEIMESRPMELVAESTSGLELRYNPEEQQPCTC